MSDEPIRVSREDAWRIYELMEQMHDFLHQQDNYRTQSEVAEWLDKGVYEELRQVFYRVVAKWFPVDDDGHVVPPGGMQRRFPE